MFKMCFLLKINHIISVDIHSVSRLRFKISSVAFWGYFNYLEI